MKDENQIIPIKSLKGRQSQEMPFTQT